MNRAEIRIPDKVLPTPEVRPLPEAPPLRRLLGPSIILAGLSVGSGEFVLWPKITSEFGFALFWAAWIGVTIQFFLNMEIERWTLCTGESAVTGFFRLSRFFGPLFLLCATVPWIWPGWSTGAATLLSWEIGFESDNLVIATAVTGLVLCGAILSLGPVVYRTVEWLMIVLVTVIFVLLVVVAWQVVSYADVRELLAGAMQLGHIPEGVHLPVLLGALAFAGAGGALNLSQSNYIKDKGYGMGKYVGRITSPLTGRVEATADVGYTFETTDENLARFRFWWKRTNLEHFFSFFILCLLSLTLFCLVAHALLPKGVPGEGLGFVLDQSIALREQFGPMAGHAFLITGILVLFTTELALLDAVSRVAADTLKVTFYRGKGNVGLSRLYFFVLWGLIAFGTAVLLVGFDKPFTLLVISAALNGFVMFVYSGLLLWLNTRTFRGSLRPHPVRMVMLLGAFLFFGYFSVLIVVDRLGL